MRLTLKVLTYCDQYPPDAQVRTFDTFPIIVGRSMACDYCLTDPHLYVSSNHAVVLVENNKLLIRDTSSNGLYVNGMAEPVGREKTMQLNDNDTIVIGDYKLSVTIESTHTDAASSSTSANKRSVPANEYDPFRGDDPFRDSFSTSDNKSDLDDWGLNETTANKDSSTPVVDDWADWPPDFAQKPARETPPASRQSINPRRQRHQQAPVDKIIKPDYTPRRVQPMEQPARASARPSVDHFNAVSDNDPVASVSSASELRVLLRAASLRESDFSHLDNAVVLEQTGRLLAQMVDAMMVLLRSRAELKNYMHSDNTQLARSGNNPLKFSASSTDALAKLLANEGHGYMRADLAVEEAVDDLKLHQLAMLEGMKLAIRSLLLKFDPNKLASELEDRGGLAASFPVTREAKLWEIFCEQYDEIREEAVNDFAELFGAEFRKTYEKYAKKRGKSPDF